MKKQQTFLTTVLLIAVVFTIGVIIGNTWRTGEGEAITKILRQSELDAESFLVEQELFESFETNCVLAENRLSGLSAELWELGKILAEENAENKLGLETYKYLKRKYHLMQIRTYVLERKLIDDCGKKANIILYYYDRQDPLSKQQGLILDTLVNQYNIHVFAIEYNYSPELIFLEEHYSITHTPTLIINFDHTRTGLVTEDQLAPLLHG